MSSAVAHLWASSRLWGARKPVGFGERTVDEQGPGMGELTPGASKDQGWENPRLEDQDRGVRGNQGWEDPHQGCAASWGGRI